jgi:amino acid transporter
MSALRRKPIGLRVQAVSIFVLVALWHFALLINQQQGENALVLLQGCLFLLPLLTTLLALIVLETRIRHRERGPWWAYLSIFVGLVPWIWWAYTNLSA